MRLKLQCNQSHFAEKDTHEDTAQLFATTAIMQEPKDNGQFEETIHQVLQSADNLASAAELRQQAATAWKAFQQADLDHSGTISVTEVQALADYMGLPISADDDTALLILDTDQSGCVEPAEFVRWYASSSSDKPPVSMNDFCQVASTSVCESQYRETTRNHSGASVFGVAQAIIS